MKNKSLIMATLLLLSTTPHVIAGGEGGLAVVLQHDDSTAITPFNLHERARVAQMERLTAQSVAAAQEKCRQRKEFLALRSDQIPSNLQKTCRTIVNNLKIIIGQEETMQGYLEESFFTPRAILGTMNNDKFRSNQNMVAAQISGFLKRKSELGAHNTDANQSASGGQTLGAEIDDYFKRLCSPAKTVIVVPD